MKNPKTTSTSDSRTFIVFDKDVVILSERYFKAGQRRRWWFNIEAGLSVDHPNSMDSRDRITVSPDHYHFEEEIVTKTITTTETKTVRRI